MLNVDVMQSPYWGPKNITCHCIEFIHPGCVAHGILAPWLKQNFVFYYPVFFMAQGPLVGQGLLIIDVSRWHSFRHTALRRTPLDERWARHRDLYLTTHNNHKRQTSMPPVAFKSKIPAREWRQTLRLRPRGHWDRHHPVSVVNFIPKPEFPLLITF
jgi:hypothetical protein